MGLLSNSVSKESLKPGDHIYSWRAAYVYAHHGIFVGDDKVIHFTRPGREIGIGTGTVLDLLLVSSSRLPSLAPCEVCGHQQDGHGVFSSCLDCFLVGGNLCRFDYSVSRALFLATVRGGTCTRAASDPADVVIHRAKYLLENGFGCYNMFKNNCENFAVYCKTGLLVANNGMIGQSGQASSVINGPVATVLSASLRLVTTSVYGMVASGVTYYCYSRYAADIGMRRDAVKVSVEDLSTVLAILSPQVIEPPMTVLASPMTALVSPTR